MSTRHFCLKWNNFQTNILNAFESLQNTEDLTDVTLTCEGISLKAHKFILSACSPYFRSIFKENPCSHPVVILKDVQYLDLVAIINFMYHGEVLVSEDQLSSFLQTGKLLQVSGLNDSIDNPLKKSITTPQKRIKKSNEDGSPKKVKISSKIKRINSDNNAPKDTISDNLNTSANESENEGENKDEIIKEESSESMPILEAALDLKSGSILERSLTSQSGKSPSSVESSITLHTFPETSKTNFIPRKPPEIKSDKILAIERPCEILQQTIKVEGDTCDNNESSMPEDAHIVFQPHHSSQCGNCPHCGKIYSNQSALKYHVRLVHSDLTNMYCCHLCPEAFDYREGYKKHMSEAHSVRT